MWIYCGGRTTGTVVDELKRAVKVVGYEMVGDLLDGKESVEGVRGVLLTDMSLSTLLDWKEVREVSKRYGEVRVVAVTTRTGELPPASTLPENLEVRRVERMRLDGILETMTGDEG